jgi:spermidine synthase
MTAASENQPHQGRGFLGYIVLTAMVCGALVMVIEVLGSRVIGPFYGVSLFVWTSLITVTLVALAAGYVAGGLLADRREDPAGLYWIILAAGVAALAIPYLRLPVLLACQSLGLRGGAFASALFLFGPALFLLGCVSPCIVKIAAKEMRNIGRTVGLLYAVSTFGSFLGTVCTGFLLIAWFGVSRIFTVVGLLLIALAAAYFLLFRKRPLFLLLLLIAIPLCLPGRDPVRAKKLADGTRVTRVHGEESFYGSIRVVDHGRAGGTVRALMIDGLTQGRMELGSRLPISRYIYFMEFLPYALHPAGKSCLVIGLGAGLVPTWYEQRGIRTDVVEIDPRVAAAARDYFGFRTYGELFIADARYHLNHSGRRYDYVVLDVFNGDTTPGHVLSLEALRLVRRAMTGDGILAVNLIGSLKKETFMTASIIRTLREVFATVEIYPVFAQEEGEEWGNLAVIAHDGPPRRFDPALTAGFPVHPEVEGAVHNVMGRRFSFPEGTPAIVLTDDYNPLDFYDTWLKEELRKRVLESQEAEMLG